MKSKEYPKFSVSNNDGKFEASTFCQVVSRELVKGWKDVGKIFIFEHEGEEMFKAKINSIQPSTKHDVLMSHVPSMFMELAESNFRKKLNNIPEEFNFVVFEKITLE